MKISLILKNLLYFYSFFLEDSIKVQVDEYQFSQIDFFLKCVHTQCIHDLFRPCRAHLPLRLTAWVAHFSHPPPLLI